MTLKTEVREYDTEVSLKAVIDEFITKKKNLSPNDKWTMFNSIAREFGFEEYNGDLQKNNELVKKINTEIRKRGLAVW